MRKAVRFILLLNLVITSLPTYAAWVSTELEAPKTGSPRISMQFLQSQYATDATLDTQSNSYQYVMPRLYAKSPEKQAFQFEMDFNGILPLSEAAESHYFFPDLYMGLKDQKRGLSVYFGRKRQQWSQLDDEMGLGLWQPLFRWDQARPLAMGLTGFHFESKHKLLQFNAMVSPFFLPDQQSDFEIIDGQIVSGNRWFRQPLRYVKFGKSDSIINYDVLKPEIADVVLNESYAFSARLGKSTGGFIKASWANKPINQFHLGVNAKEILRLDQGQSLDISVEPFVVRHELRTVEAGYIERDFRSFISFTAEIIEDPKLQDKDPSKSYEETELIDSNYLGMGIEHRAPLPYIPNSKFTWSFARRDKADKQKDEATRIEGEWGASTQRLPFENWFSFKWDAIKPLAKKRSVQTSVIYSYSPSDDGDWLAFNTTLSWNEKWQWYVSGDIFGAGNIENELDRSFITIYRNNDRVQGGFVYVF